MHLSRKAAVEHRAEPPQPIQGVVGNLPGPIRGHQARGLGVRPVLVQAADRQGLQGAEMPAQLIQAEHVGQAVDAAVRACQRVSSLGLVQGLPFLQMPYQLTQDTRIEHHPFLPLYKAWYRR
jgi:hypothetical protein